MFYKSLYTSASSIVHKNVSINQCNPFNMDLDAVSKYQKETKIAKTILERREYQIIKRTMDTKALKSVGIEKLKHENRQEKYKLPELFKINHINNDLHMNEIDKKNCKYTSVIDKLKNQEIHDKHLKRKETKLKSILKKKVDDEMRLDTKKLDNEIKDNLAFDIAEKSFENFFAVPDVIPINERAKFTIPRKIVNYPVNEKEMQQLIPQKFQNQLTRKNGQMNMHQSMDGLEYGIHCGQKIGDKILLRSFKDRLCNEPRGKFSYFHLKENLPSTCHTYDEWLNDLTNDSDILVISIH